MKSAVAGWVAGCQSGDRSGKTVLVLGPKWRFHYYGHLDEVLVKKGQWVSTGTTLGTVGNSGNAAGKQPHLHYAICSLFPYPWRWKKGPQGWKHMFFLNPHRKLTNLSQKRGS